jgi:hypothetical protein
MTVLLQDDFNRADGAVGSPVVGGPYTSVNGGSWIIAANELTLTTNVTNALLLGPAAFNVDISLKAVSGQSSTRGTFIVFRYVDANNYWVFGRAGSGTVALYRNVAGTFTAFTENISVGAGDTIRVRAYDDLIFCYINGAYVGRTHDPFASLTSATQAGIRNGGSSSVITVDDLLIQTQDAPLAPTWGAAPEAFDGVDVDLSSDLLLTPSLYKGRDSALQDESETP